LDQLQEDHLRRVGAARAKLDDPRVAAWSLGVTRRDLLEELVDHEAVLTELRERLAASVEVAALGKRDQLLDLRLDGLGLRLARLYPLVLDHLAGEVSQERPAMRRVAAQLVPLLAVAHGRRLFVAEREPERVQRVLHLF